MCGIAGIVNRVEGPAPDLGRLKCALTALHHRGPDERGIYRDPHAGLAHTRLSIIDLASGQQPLSTPDQDLWIAFNGEIFNYVELREELGGLGHRFHTHSDTEVIVAAWRQWGEDALRRFNGQWAIALWDRARRRLVLSRDRLGIRPLYYAESPRRVVFGSEVKALFAADPELARAFDPEGLDETFTFWTVVAPRSVFAGVRELRPGHLRVYEDGQVDERAYWAPSYARSRAERVGGSIEESAEAVSEALERATALRMLRADVEVGSYLSGGLDSSLIATLGLRAKGAGFHTFSVRFEDAEYDETSYQRLMAERLGTEHHEIVARAGDIARVFPEVVRCGERPILRTAPAPLFLLSRLVREHGIKVVLTGEGADEMFGGYDIFREGVIRRFWGRDPESERRPLLLDKLYPYLARSPVQQKALARAFFGKDLDEWDQPGFAHGTRWRTTAAIKRLLAPSMRADVDVVGELLADLPADFPRWSFMSQDQYLEVRTLLAGYLLSSQGDRMLMGNSVEGRFPFLDHNVVDLANHLPDHHKIKVLDEKHVLKRLGADLLPPEILQRPKQPYRAPDALAFVRDTPAWVGEVLSPDAVEAAGVFAPKAADKLWQKCLSRADAGQFSNTDNMMLVAVLSTQLLHRDLIAAAPESREADDVRIVGPLA